MIAALQPKTYSDAQHERYDLQSQLFETVCQVACNQGVIDRPLLEEFADITKSQPSVPLTEAQIKASGGYDDAVDFEADEKTKPNLLNYAKLFVAAKTPEAQRQAFGELKTNLEGLNLNDRQLGQLADLMTLLVPAMNAANGVRERSAVESQSGLEQAKLRKVGVDSGPSEAARILKNYFVAGLKAVDKEGKNAFGMKPSDWLDKAIKTKEKIILAICNTCHPTNFYTEFGQVYQKDFYDAVDGKKLGHSGVLQENDLKKVVTLVEKNCDAIKRKNDPDSITFLKQTTVGEEADMEEKILKAEKDSKNKVLGVWNESVSAAVDIMKAGDKKPGFHAPKYDATLLTTSHFDEAMEKQCDALKITPEDKERMYQQHSWNWATADKDGRHLVTDTTLYAGYMRSLNEQGEYTGPAILDMPNGPILDLRENAEERKKTIGALISVQYDESNNGFKTTCNEFCSNEKLRREYGGEVELGKHWNNHDKSTYHMLSEKNKTAFLRYLMTKDSQPVDLFNHESERTSTLNFNKAFYHVYKDLLEEYKLDQHTQFGDLIKYDRKGAPGHLIDELLDRMKDRQTLEKYGVEETYKMNRINSQIKGKDGAFPIVGFDYHREKKSNPITSKQFTQNGNFDPGQPASDHVKGPNCPVRELDEMEAQSCMAYLRRLFLLNEFVDEQGPKGKIVAEWEESANFANPSDFFTQLYLFQQAGLITIENGLVTGKPKIGIMPLFETVDDVKRGRGEVILDGILDTKLGESYYQQRGKAEIMLGYSDGGKSGGNFAAHYYMREFKKMAVRKFKDKFGENFEVIVKHGYGRDENRGGTRRYDRQYLMHHNESNDSAFSNQTGQGDFIVRMRTDEKFAERTMAEMYVSAMAGAVEAQREKEDLEKAQGEKEDLKKRRNESFENVLAYLAEHSETHFQNDIFTKTEEGSAYIGAVYKNNEASSRSSVRPATNQKGIGPERAIPVALAAGISELPFHDYGFDSAMKEYENDVAAPKVLDKDGNEVSGREALKIMAQDCDFFQEELKSCELRQQAFNEAIADIWEEKAIEGAKKAAAKKDKSPDEAAENQRIFFKKIREELTGLGDFCHLLRTGDEQAKSPVRQDYTGEPYTSALAAIGNAIFSLFNLKTEGGQSTPLGNKVHFTVVNKFNEKPAGPMLGRIPGLPDSHDGAYMNQQAIFATP